MKRERMKSQNQKQKMKESRVKWLLIFSDEEMAKVFCQLAIFSVVLVEVFTQNHFSQTCKAS